MKFMFSFTLCFLCSSILTANSLVDKAKTSGLVGIPEHSQELLKIISDEKDPITKEKIELGKKLYFDPRLSKSSLISCNTCHNLALAGVDGLSTAIGHGWTVNPHHLNSPTVFNAVFYKAQFWDGRSPHLANQAQGPVQAGPEMAASKDLVEQRINSIPAYVQEFRNAYGKNVKINFEKITSAISIFERTLVTPSRFDKFMNGNDKSLSNNEKEGLKIFIDKGCTSCHSGIAFGGTMQPFQIASKYKFINVGDFIGDINGMVKTPTLRNITQTAPYFHNGQIWSLKEAIKEMGSVQLGIEISDMDASKIETFLKALDGKIPEFKYPLLPASTIDTPKPDYN